MNRAIRVLLILLWFELGVIVLVVPWAENLWAQNFFLSRFPDLGRILLNPYLRGAISGLGLVNMLFAAQAMLFRGEKPVASES